MALIEFELRKTKEIIPWGDGVGQLSWFGFTDGFYHLKVGKDELFRYSNEILSHWKQLYPGTENITQPYVDYQVVRLYEDLLEILSDILNPIPKELQGLVQNHAFENNWLSKWKEKLDLVGDKDEKTINIFYVAKNWWSARQLRSIHLNQPPSIVIWRFEDEVFIRWDGQSKQIESIPVWSNQAGDYKMSVGEFLREIESFHNRFMSAMKERVNEIANCNPIPHVSIDIERLIEEQSEREGFLKNAIKRPPDPESNDWESIVQANIQLGLLQI